MEGLKGGTGSHGSIRDGLPIFEASNLRLLGCIVREIQAFVGIYHKICQGCGLRP